MNFFASSLAVLLLSSLLILPAHAARGTTASTPSYPNTPTTPQPDTASPPSRVVFDDEDPEASRVAWLRGRAGGSGTNFIEDRLIHPSSSFVLPEREPAGRERAGAGEVFVFRAKKVDRGKKSTEVPVERVEGNLRGEDGERRERTGRSGSSRGRQRFNEGGLRRGGSKDRTMGWSGEQESPVSPDRDVREERTFGRTIPVEGGQHSLNIDAQHGLGLRSESPTRWALDNVASRLSSLDLNNPHTTSPRASLSPTSDSEYHFHDARSAEISSASPPSPHFPDLHSGGTSTPRTPPPPPPKLAPYRMWSAASALPHVNIPYTKLTSIPPSYPHWQSSLSALRENEWTNQLDARVKWAAENRIDTSRPARVVTPFGAVTGGDIDTGLSPRFIDDPSNPPPRLDSVLLTGTQRRIHAFRELVELIPPALTHHSKNIYNTHTDDIDKDIHPAVHPIQYINSILRDKNAAVILENSIHSDLHDTLANVPKEALSHLQRDHKRSGARRDHTTSVEQLLGTDYALHNTFWYPYYHNKPAFKINNPLDTPLEHFAAFSPFADAVALKKV
ncbi:hypothetical protein PHSY_002695 [Pseudozyma hubeiensis SY62]|uniref:Uncharacterized protein n=1 Tax=Pseudozyma hubeiensis (strain SY62) TaxID=1305764 RepID=R9PAJ2_PSEHS|nr:hypothetical protein PHSY_002695 [Pseudozyma hubeiensis SY62]GAC95120.1 hypothetical protein PHSY_002695 [Pseudozyma hubeiensis SY62]